MEEEWNSPNVLLGILAVLAGFIGLIWKAATWKNHQEEVNTKQDKRLCNLERKEDKYEELLERVRVLSIHAEYARKHFDAIIEGRKIQKPDEDS